MSVFLLPLLLALLAARGGSARRRLRLLVGATLLCDLLYVLLVVYCFPRIAP